MKEILLLSLLYRWENRGLKTCSKSHNKWWIRDLNPVSLPAKPKSSKTLYGLTELPLPPALPPLNDLKIRGLVPLAKLAPTSMLNLARELGTLGRCSQHSCTWCPHAPFAKHKSLVLTLRQNWAHPKAPLFIKGLRLLKGLCSTQVKWHFPEEWSFSACAAASLVWTVCTALGTN